MGVAESEAQQKQGIVFVGRRRAGERLQEPGSLLHSDVPRQRRRMSESMPKLCRSSGIKKQAGAEPSQGRMSFEDVAVYFTKGQGALLGPDQRALYKEVMMENYANVSALEDMPVPKPELITQLEEGKKPWVQDLQDLDGMENSSTYSGEYTGEKSYQCSECQKCFTHKAHLMSHKKVHRRKKSYECEECGECFPQKINLVRHQKVHEGDNPCQCLECGKFFPWKSELKRHQRIHTGEKPYKCSECGSSFAWKSHLVRHQERHTGAKPFKCRECGNTYTRSENLIIHERTHTGEKPYKCLECGKSFFRAAIFARHQMHHTGEKLYHCLQCGKYFAHGHSLSEHKRLRHKKKNQEESGK